MFEEEDNRAWKGVAWTECQRASGRPAKSEEIGHGLGLGLTRKRVWRRRQLEDKEWVKMERLVMITIENTLF